jgi:hypothetical protein
MFGANKYWGTQARLSVSRLARNTRRYSFSEVMATPCNNIGARSHAPVLGILLSICIAGCMVEFAGCEKDVPNEPPLATSESPPATPETRHIVQLNADACGLITREEIQQVQGSSVKQMKGTGTSDGRVRALQCYYSTEPPNRSVILMATQNDPEAKEKNGARELWQQIFAKYDRMKSKHMEEEDRNHPDTDEEQEHKVEVKEIEGTGDQAFWVSSRVAALLYVRKKDSYICVNVFGPDPEEARLSRARTLAQKALDRL